MLCTKRYRIVAAGGVSKQTNKQDEDRGEVCSGCKVCKERAVGRARKRSDAVDEIVRLLGAKGQPPNVFDKSPAVGAVQLRAAPSPAICAPAPPRRLCRPREH